MKILSPEMIYIKILFIQYYHHITIKFLLLKGIEKNILNEYFGLLKFNNEPVLTIAGLVLR